MTVEYVPAIPSTDDTVEMLAKSRAAGTFVLRGGKWLTNYGHADVPLQFYGWSELSVKLALLGLNPPVLKALADSVIRAKSR